MIPASLRPVPRVPPASVLSSTPSRLPLAAAWPLLLAIAVLLLSWPLLRNPGYFSHDELQWAVFAADGSAAPWYDTHAFQYRPLAFSTWMALSRALFATPMQFHLVLAAWGAANAVLLALLGRGFGLRRWPAALAALGFALGPFAAYVHGWVGCIADLLWLSCALLLGLAVQRARHPWQAALAAAVLTAAALLAKEAALAIPPLLWLGGWWQGRPPAWRAAWLAAAAVAAAWLAWRWDALLHAPQAGAQYALSAWHVPRRWLEYQLFPPLLPTFEIGNSLRRLPLALAAALVWLGVLAALWRAGRRWPALWLLGGLATLLPVLPLATSANQYGYGYSALAALVLAGAWPRTSRAGRAAIALLAMLAVLHGAVVMRQIRQVGRIQAVFSPALAAAVAARGDGPPLRLRPGPGARDWVFRRLTHQIPRYAGVAIGARVQLVETDAPAEFEITPDGRLHRLGGD